MCMHCDVWESQAPHCTVNARADLQAFCCQSGHTSCIQPNALKKVWRPSYQGTRRRVIPGKGSSTTVKLSSKEDEEKMPELVVRGNDNSSDIRKKRTSPHHRKLHKAVSVVTRMTETLPTWSLKAPVGTQMMKWRAMTVLTFPNSVIRTPSWTLSTGLIA